MYVYAVAGLLLGLAASLGYPPIAVPLVLGVASVVVGTARSAYPGVLPSVLLVVGGITVGGLIGLAAVTWDYEESWELAAGFGLGALLLGWPPIVVGTGRLALRHLRRRGVA